MRGSVIRCPSADSMCLEPGGASPGGMMADIAAFLRVGAMTLA
jgi:hypothetical protein